MDTLKEKYINLIKKNHPIVENNKDAELILDEISNIVTDEILEDFIINDLCIFNNKKYAFNWFFDDSQTGSIQIDNIDFEIESYMIGNNIKDILLEGKENYIKINDNLHLTYWI